MIRPYAKYAFVIFSLFAAVILGACEKIDTKSVKNNSLHSQDTRDAYGGVYYRIQADYELIETGEPLNFDFIISCYNREVPGSFNGVLKPTTMFKATSTGAAIAISPPKAYCQRAVNGQKLEKETDLLKMPLLAWYPDVTNLSYALVYMTNDAYTGPQAKIRFKGYKYSRTDKAAFLAWEAKALETYEQIGAIPGPFGCAPENVSVNDPHFCASTENMERNNGLLLAIADRGRWTRSAEVVDISSELSQLLKDYKNVESDIYCNYANPVLNADRQLAITAGIYPTIENSDLKTELLTVTRKHVRESGYRETGEFLNPEALLFQMPDVKIREIYPVVNHKHPLFKQTSKFRIASNDQVLAAGGGGALNNQIVYEEKWRGFAIIAQQRPIDYFLKSMKPTQYVGEHRGVLFLNDRLVCEKSRPNIKFEFTDFTMNKMFKVN